MYPPIFVIASADAAVKALLGTGTANDPLRLYLFGEAPQKVVLPYAVWQTVGGAPENYLNMRPDADNFSVQVDVYGKTPSSIRAVVKALNDALENKAYITRWGSESFDEKTTHYRSNFDVEFITQR